MSVDVAGAAAPEPDPLFKQAESCLQEGRWDEAGAALASLKGRYGATAEVRELECALALHLSAEETWADAQRRSLPALLRVPEIRALAIANAAIYLLLLLMWLAILLIGR